jgi:hypothetical protein
MPLSVSLEDWIESLHEYVCALQIGSYSHAWLRGPVHATLYATLGLVQRNEHYYSDSSDSPLRTPPYIEESMVWIDLSVKAWPALRQEMMLHPEAAACWFEGLHGENKKDALSMV